jgi:hypothetical protein
VLLNVIRRSGSLAGSEYELKTDGKFAHEWAMEHGKSKIALEIGYRYVCTNNNVSYFCFSNLCHMERTFDYVSIRVLQKREHDGIFPEVYTLDYIGPMLKLIESCSDPQKATEIIKDIFNDLVSLT